MKWEQRVQAPILLPSGDAYKWKCLENGINAFCYSLASLQSKQVLITAFSYTYIESQRDHETERKRKKTTFELLMLGLAFQHPIWWYSRMQKAKVSLLFLYSLHAVFAFTIVVVCVSWGLSVFSVTWDWMQPTARKILLVLCLGCILLQTISYSLCHKLIPND